MKRIVITGIIILILIALKVYGVYYYVYSKMTYELKGFSFYDNSSTIAEMQGTSLASLVESISVNFVLKNPTKINARIKNLNLKVVDKYDKEIGSITTIKEIIVPKNGQTDLAIFIEHVNTNELTRDFLDSSIKDYKYVVSGWLGGVMPFRYSAKITA